MPENEGKKFMWQYSTYLYNQLKEFVRNMSNIITFLVRFTLY